MCHQNSFEAEKFWASVRRGPGLFSIWIRGIILSLYPASLNTFWARQQAGSVGVTLHIESPRALSIYAKQKILKLPV
jgi:hypothetical protein